MAIIISGKVHPKTTQLLDNYIGDISANGRIQSANDNESTGGKIKKIHIDKPASVQTSVKIGSTTINKRHQDYPGLKVLDTVLGGYFGSRLMKNLREDKGYTYGIGSSVSSLDLTGYKLISAEVGRQYTERAVDEIHKEIRLLQNQTVQNEEMTIVRNYMSGGMMRMFDGPFALAESFRSVWEFGLDTSYYYRLYEKIRTIQPDEIIELARTYYNIDDLYEITVGQE